MVDAGRTGLLLISEMPQLQAVIGGASIVNASPQQQARHMPGLAA